MLFLKYRLPLLVILFALLGYGVYVLTRLGELRWYYLAGTPGIAVVVALIFYFLPGTPLMQALRSKSGWVLGGLLVLFATSLFLHVKAYDAGTFQYTDVDTVRRTYIKGTRYEERAIKFKNKPGNSYISSDEILLEDGFGGIDGRTDVWGESIAESRSRIITTYCSTIFFMASFFAWVVGVGWEKRYLDPRQAIADMMAEKSLTAYEKYLLSYRAKSTDDKFRKIKYHIFLSYSGADKDIAERIAHSLSNSGHIVFFDHQSLPPGLEYDNAIATAIAHSDLFLFLISPTAVADGRYTRTELKFASDRWPNASGVLLPVMVETTPFNAIPAYASSVTVLQPQGNIVAEVTAAVNKLYDGVPQT
jgi:hypothetical protein